MECAGKALKLLSLSVALLITATGCSTAAQRVQTEPTLPPVKIYNGGRVFFVSPEGDDDNTGLSSKYPLKHIQSALELAQPGDTIVLMPGTYRENIKTVRDGLPGKPITVVGTPGSLIVGNDKPKGRIIDVRNSYIQLLHLNINGQFADCTEENCYHDKLIYIHGSPEKMLSGIRVEAVNLKNALGECLRIKYSENSEIAWNSISHCGLRDFVFGRGKQNGEGIYVGTAPEQTHGHPDHTKNILIRYNTIATYGAECVDVKEGATKIVIENNVCLKSMQKTSGGISVRGNREVIRYNIVFDNKGAGIRLGGDTKEFGIENEVTYNFLDNNLKAALKIMRTPQDKMCSNRSTDTEKLYYPKEKRFMGAFEPCNR